MIGALPKTSMESTYVRHLYTSRVYYLFKINTTTDRWCKIFEKRSTKLKLLKIMTTATLIACVSCGGSGGSSNNNNTDNTKAMASNTKIIFLHHSTGQVIWDAGVPDWFTSYNSANGKSYSISAQDFPDAPYAWTTLNCH